MVNAAAYQRGLPVVEPLGAMVEALGPGLYRGWFLTRALEGATLWNLLLDGGEAAVRRMALEQTRGIIKRLHDGGLYHADLNFHNLFVCTSADPFAVVVLDLDKARLYPGPLAPALRRRNLRRRGPLGAQTGQSRSISHARGSGATRLRLALKFGGALPGLIFAYCNTDSNRIIGGRSG